MEKIVEGSRRGIPEFYIVIRKMKETEQTSFILLDKKERETLVFQVRSFGYDKEAFRKFYLKLRWLVPGKVRIIGTKKQTVWKQKAKKHWVGPAFARLSFLSYTKSSSVSAFVVPKVRKRNGDGHEKKVEEAVGKHDTIYDQKFRWNRRNPIFI